MEVTTTIPEGIAGARASIAGLLAEGYRAGVVCEALACVSADLDWGERAALALALAIELHTDLVLIDDSAGRKEAVALRIPITGTVGVLRLAAER